MDFSKTFIIVPCYNESECIAATLKHLSKSVPGAEIVAINDASSDNTLEILRLLDLPGLTVLNMPFNTGIGTVVQTGLLYALRNGAAYAVKFDGDGQHPADEIVKLLAPLLEKRADLVVGSRFLAGNNGFKSTACRRIGIRFFTFLSYLLTGRALTDCTSGFRAYNRRALEFAARYYPAFDYPEPEESILLLRNGYRVLEENTVMLARQGGSSSIRPGRAIYYMLKVGFAMIMERMRSPKIWRS